MDSNSKKHRIIQDCKNQISDAVSKAQTEIKLLHESALQVESPDVADWNESHDDMMLDDLRSKEKHLEYLQLQLGVLDSLSPDNKDVVAEFGSVIITDKMNILVAVASNFTSDEKKFTGISTSSPIFSALKGKKVGEKWEFRGLTQQILEIF